MNESINQTFKELSVLDIPLLLEIETDCHISPWSEGMFVSSFNRHSVNFALLDDAKKLIGYYIAEFISGEMTLHNICVRKENQRAGVASKLMGHFIEQSNIYLTEEVWLEVRESNISAINLYKKFGFEQKGVRKNYYSVPKTTEDGGPTKENALLMCLSLIDY